MYVYHMKRHAIYSIISLFSHLLGNSLSMEKKYNANVGR